MFTTNVPGTAGTSVHPFASDHTCSPPTPSWCSTVKTP